MLDLAFGLTDTSRLGCQVKLDKKLEGMVARLPHATRNIRDLGGKGQIRKDDIDGKSDPHQWDR